MMGENLAPRPRKTNDHLQVVNIPCYVIGIYVFKLPVIIFNKFNMLTGDFGKFMLVVEVLPPTQHGHFSLSPTCPGHIQGFPHKLIKVTFIYICRLNS